MHPVIASLRKEGIPVYLAGPSAISFYYSDTAYPIEFYLVKTDLSGLARVIEGLEFPGSDFVDAVYKDDEVELLFLCKEEPGFPRWSNTDFFNFYAKPMRRDFFDKYGIFQAIKQKEIYLPTYPLHDFEYALTIVLSSSYNITIKNLEMLKFTGGMDTHQQRWFLSLLVTAQDPESGFSLLKQTNFFIHYWPEIADLDQVDHSKEYHPEGDLWQHTMETFSHRKSRDLLLSLSLLLHDIGKPDSPEFEGNRFHDHSNIGAELAVRFLKNLGFALGLQRDVRFLVKHHMLPMALQKSVPYNLARILSDPLFPKLLEVFRCDLSSTFQGPEPYYRACKTYKRFKKHTKNPYRRSDGRILSYK